ncbi:unnamed protein product [Moneuplotes crassus]|uniref:Uncharacterized protein n=1 Tax=Euplotes crassus TaxID=5936 RepID=A0AAD1Y8H9_EUPCR|nr:unnamed protein product [Moneuplotes crassus]
MENREIRVIDWDTYCLCRKSFEVWLMDEDKQSITKIGEKILNNLQEEKKSDCESDWEIIDQESNLSLDQDTEDQELSLEIIEFCYVMLKTSENFESTLIMTKPDSALVFNNIILACAEEMKIKTLAIEAISCREVLAYRLGFLVGATQNSCKCKIYSSNENIINSEIGAKMMSDSEGSSSGCIEILGFSKFNSSIEGFFENSDQSLQASLEKVSLNKTGLKTGILAHHSSKSGSEENFKADPFYCQQIDNLLEIIIKDLSNSITEKYKEKLPLKSLDSENLFLTKIRTVFEDNKKIIKFKPSEEEEDFFWKYYAKQLVVKKIIEEKVEKNLLESIFPKENDQQDITTKSCKCCERMKRKFCLKGHRLVAKVKLYGCVFYTIIRHILDYRGETDTMKTQTLHDLLDCIYKTLKNYYNSKYVTKEQKAIIKKDKKIKYMIAEIMRMKGLWGCEGKKFQLYPKSWELFHNLFKNSSPKTVVHLLLEMLKSIIKESK